MNRSLTSLGAALVVLALALLAYPVVVSGAWRIGLPVMVAIVLLPAGLLVVLLGASSPDPRLTTVGGIFGNPEENLLRKRLVRGVPVGPARYRPSPLESTNCGACYTAIPAGVLDCPRCGHRRECRNCNKPLYFLAGGIRCAPCLKGEIYCDCPRVKRTAAVRVARGPGPR